MYKISREGKRRIASGSSMNKGLSLGGSIDDGDDKRKE